MNGNIRVWVWVFVCVANFALVEAKAADSHDYLGSMPDSTIFIQCPDQFNPCAKQELENKAVFDAQSRPAGVYIYLLADVASGMLWSISVLWSPPAPGEPALTRKSPRAVPSDVSADWPSYQIYAKDGIPIQNVPASVSATFPSDLAGHYDVGNWLRGQSWANNIFLAASKPIVTVKFSDGHTAQYIYARYASTIPFEYVIGSHRDPQGQVIPDGDQGLGADNGIQYAGGRPVWAQQVRFYFPSQECRTYVICVEEAGSSKYCYIGRICY